MSAKHTPGEWVVKTGGTYLAEIVATSKRGKQWVIARITSAKVGTDEAKTNARLIAAAPDLLEALKELCRQADMNDCVGHFWDVAKSAIAKAEGEP